MATRKSLPVDTKALVLQGVRVQVCESGMSNGAYA
jgi:hypothetical protein